MNFEIKEDSPTTYFWSNLKAIENDWNSSIQPQEYFPILKPTCVKNAINEFMSACTKYTSDSINPTIRAWTAVKLSICEFEAVGLKNIPTICYSDDLEPMMECMLEIDHSTQWWTTYSGNYQRLSTLCNDYNSYYQERKLVETLLNLTNFNYEYNKILNKKLVYAAQENVINLKNQFKNASNAIERTMKSNIETQEILWKQHTMNQKNYFDLSFQELSRIQNISELLQDQINKASNLMSDHLRYISREINKSNVVDIYEQELKKFYKVSLEEQKRYKSHIEADMSQMFKTTKSIMENVPSIIDDRVSKYNDIANQELSNIVSSMESKIIYAIQDLMKENAIVIEEDLDKIEDGLNIIMQELSGLSNNITDISETLHEIVTKIDKVTKTFLICWDVFIYCIKISCNILVFCLYKINIWIFLFVFLYYFRRSFPKRLLLAKVTQFLLLISLVRIGTIVGELFVDCLL